MLNPEEARAARESLAGVLAAADAGEVEARRGERAVIAGAVAALDSMLDEPPAAESDSGSYDNGTFVV